MSVEYKEVHPSDRVVGLTTAGSIGIGAFTFALIANNHDNPHVEAQQQIDGLQQDHAYLQNTIKVLVSEPQSPDQAAVIKFLNNKKNETQHNIAVAKQNQPESYSLSEFAGIMGGLMGGTLAVGLLGVSAIYKARNAIGRRREASQSAA